MYELWARRIAQVLLLIAFLAFVGMSLKLLSFEMNDACKIKSSLSVSYCDCIFTTFLLSAPPLIVAAGLVLGWPHAVGHIDRVRNLKLLIYRTFTRKSAYPFWRKLHLRGYLYSSLRLTSPLYQRSLRLVRY